MTNYLCLKCAWVGTEPKWWPNGFGPWCPRCVYMVVEAKSDPAPISSEEGVDAQRG